VAVVGGNDGKQVVFASDSEMQQATVAAEGKLNLFGPPMLVRAAGNRRGAGPPADYGRFAGGRGDDRSDALARFRVEPLRYASAANDWQLIVRNRKGSLEQAVGAMRRRNLAISFGVLILLAGTTA